MLIGQQQTSDLFFIIACDWFLKYSLLIPGVSLFDAPIKVMTLIQSTLFSGFASAVLFELYPTGVKYPILKDKCWGESRAAAMNLLNDGPSRELASDDPLRERNK